MFFTKFGNNLLIIHHCIELTSSILSKSAYGIVFSKYMKTLIPGTNVIFHGSEPWSNTINMSQKEARESRDYLHKED